MALFFDGVWFGARLGERDLSRERLAARLDITTEDLALLFKDQMELSAGQVAAFAELLGVSAAEVASRAGVSTPVPSQQTSPHARIASLERRVEALEAEIDRLKAG